MVTDLVETPSDTVSVPWRLKFVETTFVNELVHDYALVVNGLALATQQVATVPTRLFFHIINFKIIYLFKILSVLALNACSS